MIPAISLAIYVPIITFALYILILLTGAFNICWSFYTEIICKEKTTHKEIAITFDDGPSENTPQILSLLKNYNAHASFFIIGKKAEQQPELLKKIVQQGHTLGNHAYSHKNLFPFQPPHIIENEISLTNQIIQKATGKKTRLFRPPFGITNPLIISAVKKTNMTTVGWSIRSLDTVKNEKKILERITKKIKPGEIILLHDTSKHILPVLKTLLEILQDNQYKIVNLENLLNVPCYE